MAQRAAQWQGSAQFQRRFRKCALGNPTEREHCAIRSAFLSYQIPIAIGHNAKHRERSAYGDIQ